MAQKEISHPGMVCIVMTNKFALETGGSEFDSRSGHCTFVFLSGLLLSNERQRCDGERNL